MSGDAYRRAREALDYPREIVVQIPPTCPICDGYGHIDFVPCSAGCVASIPYWWNDEWWRHIIQRELGYWHDKPTWGMIECPDHNPRHVVEAPRDGTTIDILEDGVRWTSGYWRNDGWYIPSFTYNERCIGSDEPTWRHIGDVSPILGPDGKPDERMVRPRGTLSRKEK